MLRGVPGLLDVRELHARAPVLQIGRERNQVARAAGGRTFPDAAAVAHHDHTQRGVIGLIGFHQFQQSPSHLLGIGGQRHAQQRRVLFHARPMPLPGEQHPAGHMQRAEDAPACQQPDLSRRKHLVPTASWILSL